MKRFLSELQFKQGQYIIVYFVICHNCSYFGNPYIFIKKALKELVDHNATFHQGRMSAKIISRVMGEKSN